jgi:hypothetical protein
MLGEVLIVLQEQLAGLLIERWLREGLYEQAAHNHQDMPQPHVLLPIPLEDVHADVALLGDIRMEDLCQKPACIEVAPSEFCNDGWEGNCQWLKMMFGWSQYSETFFLGARDVPLGGALGKSAPSTSFILKTPPSYGVPTAKHQRSLNLIWNRDSDLFAS